TADGTCTAIPVRCSLERLAANQSATVRLTFKASHAGNYSIPIGVASKATGDSETSNNAFRFSFAAVAPATR
ncbi:MAG TPA: hypothetical protein VJP39_06135, partial [Gaiellaceae bacterium]|nr:hypothetical protein [Gaiellaceae bacterium]